jgi:anti-sigma28 factor (negative regulator of flagellin synthesis)
VSRYGTARGGTRGGYGDESNGTDNISLSGLSRTVRLLAAESPEREQRLSELAAAFEGGSYRVDAERIARSVIDETIRASF